MKRFVSKIEKFFANTPELKSLMFWFGSKDEFYLNSEDLSINGEHWCELPGMKEIEEIGLHITEHVEPLLGLVVTLDDTARKNILTIKNKLLKIKNNKYKNNTLITTSDKISVYLESLNKDLSAETRKKIFKYLSGEDCDIYCDMTVEFTRTESGIVYKTERQPVYG